MRYLAGCARPGPADGEASALRTIHDALRFAAPKDRNAVALGEYGQVLAAISWTPACADGQTVVRYLGSARKGLGRALVACAAADASSRDEGLILESLPSAAGFYRKLGFCCYGRSELGYPLFALDPLAADALARGAA